MVDEYCARAFQCEIDFSNRLTIENLVLQLELVCAPAWKLGLIGSLFLIGIVVGCSFITRLGDVYGRKLVYAAGLATNMLAVTILVFTKSQSVVFACLFALGMSITARYYVGYTYNLEW